jgi:hypothetical protein
VPWPSMTITLPEIAHYDGDALVVVDQLLQNELCNCSAAALPVSYPQPPRGLDGTINKVTNWQALIYIFANILRTIYWCNETNVDGAHSGLQLNQ